MFFHSAYTGRSTPKLLIEHFDTFSIHNADTLNICMKDFGSLKRIIDKMATMRTLTFLNKKVLCLFYDSAYMGRSTPTTAFDGAI